ncbi:MAG: GH51, partial [uncultured Quadrisphaera sp.]
EPDGHRLARPAPRLHRRPGEPEDVRLLRRAHGPVRLHRHLRAGPPVGRRGRVPHRRPRPGAGARGDRGALPRRQLRLRLPVGGRRRAGRAAPAPARPRLAQRRDQPLRPRRVHAVGGAGRRRAGAGGQPGHPRGAGGRRPARVHHRRRRHGAVGAAPQPRRGAAVPGARVVPGQRDGRPLADRAQDGARVRAPGGGDGAGDADGRPRPHAGGLRQLEPLHADLRGVGGDRARARLRAGRPDLGARLLPAGRRRPRQPPGRGARHGRVRRRRGRHGRRGARRRPAREADHDRLRRVERLVPGPVRRAGPADRVGRGAAADRGHLRRRRRGGRGQPADLPAAAQRPGGLGVPGAAGQRDRDDPQRARRPGVAADDLPPVRAGGGAGPRRGAAGAGALADLRDGPARRRAGGRRRGHPRRGGGGAGGLRGQPLDHGAGDPRRRPARLRRRAPDRGHGARRRRRAGRQHRARARPRGPAPARRGGAGRRAPGPADAAGLVERRPGGRAPQL